MAIWFQLALGLNVICWAIFLYLLTLRRWTWSALAVGAFHMLYAGLGSPAPFRAALDPGYRGLGLGLFRFEGLAAAVPAVLFLGWALAAAWLAISKKSGSWMRVIAVGDVFLALSIGGSIVVGDSSHWKFQLGEYLTIDGVPGLLVLLGLLTGPLGACAMWAIRRSNSGENTPSVRQDALNSQDANDAEKPGTNGFRYLVAEDLSR
jgi:hypothetical protein